MDTTNPGLTVGSINFANSPTIAFPVYDDIVNNPQKGALPLAIILVVFAYWIYWLMK